MEQRNFCNPSFVISFDFKKSRILSNLEVLLYPEYGNFCRLYPITFENGASEKNSKCFDILRLKISKGIP